MVYRVNRDPIIDNDRVLRVDRMRVGSFSQKFSYQGSTSGYSSGGYRQTYPPDALNVIDKFPFSSDTNSSDVGDLTNLTFANAGVGSVSHGYDAGGRAWSPFAQHNVIQKYPFSSDANATDVGDLTGQKRGMTQGQTDGTDGYLSGGHIYPPDAYVNEIERFPFSSDGNTTDVGDLIHAAQMGAGQSSETHGYTSGGTLPAPPYVNYTNVIQKFPFSSTANASDVGDLTYARYGRAGASSTTHGYTIGGYSNIIDRFPFASDANATDVGDTDGSTNSTSGHSSTTHGYISSMPPFAPAGADISKFPFATATTNTSSVGDLSVYRTETAGTHV